jgi:hypothetical protein
MNMVISVFWIWRLTNPLYTKNGFQKVFSVTILAYLFESLLNFHIYNETLTTGNNTTFFEVFILLFSGVRNVTTRAIIFAIAIGYIYLEYFFCYWRKDVDPKKTSRTTYLLVLYSIILTLYYSSVVDYKLKYTFIYIVKNLFLL